MEKYVISLDQGTTRSRAVIFDQQARIVAMKSYEFPQIYPQPGWVEHDPAAILNSQIDALWEVVRISEIPLKQIAAIGITNQRETTILWNRKTGRPVHNTIVWQCAAPGPSSKGRATRGWSPTSARPQVWYRTHTSPAAS